MKLSIRNLGRIAHAELDIRPLTIFVGPNNTNKTWAAYCLYGLARRLTFDPAASWNALHERAAARVAEFEHAELAARVRAAAERVGAASFHRGEAPRAPDVSMRITRTELLGGLLGDVRLRMDALDIMNLLRLHREPSEEAEATLDVSPSELRRGPIEELRIDVEDLARFISFTPLKRPARSEPPGQPKLFEVRDDRDRILLLNAAISAFALCLHDHVAVLPAERKALVATYKLLRPEFEEVMASPVVAFTELLRRPERLAPTEAQVEERRQAWGLLEERILGAPLHFFPHGAGPSFLFGGSPDTELPIHAASSLVRALAGLDVYLKHLASPGDLLVIDEPEMNAHPAAQLAITELLALLVNKGIRVVFTTHSPYVLDHVNNLIEASRVSAGRRDEIAARLKLGSAAAFLDPGGVAAYLFDDHGVVRSIYDAAERSIDWRTFSAVTDEAGNLYSHILAAEPK
ncbi:uncharacterized protein SOCEGT47_085230 [Sorangium cellulosum]|uniref:ATPase AAA-type core domain-containing protein n=1 Tax=Sorangium cellulosum TaxID=56 RepID=A0A4P2QFE0_SORCE|nr:AAA family ATPase [Sorangium cellulosum]AUX27923.1 uncharacterized protein SOCEGT47_085230 [Sorangium cellulosum]